jgi:dTDP-4-dehydrorhamnose 3,5-epimerase
MKFHETPLPGVWLIEPERLGDERGWFARTFDRDEFCARGMNPEVVQCNASFNFRRDTLRGMHYQAAPHGESKLVRCVSGAIFDVALDLRRDSPTFCSWYGAELSAENGHALYIPAGLAHGFQTLAEDCVVYYQMSYPYVGDSACGVRFDDPAFGIAWPEPDSELVVSRQDRLFPDFHADG